MEETINKSELREWIQERRDKYNNVNLYQIGYYNKDEIKEGKLLLELMERKFGL